jgi:arylsulfatase A-like enzyme
MTVKLVTITLVYILFVSLLQASEQPNVLIIMVDDLGYADLSSCGSEDMQTPHLDRLIGEGMRFNNFYTNSCVCSPTRAALLTGRFPEMVGMHGVTRKSREDSWGYLSPDAVMLPELFQQAGYQTTLIGKWHLGVREENRPNQRGFDEFHGFILGMMDDYWEHSRQGMQQMRRNEEAIFPKGHATDLISDWSIEALTRDAAAGKPFFQFLAYNAPHFPVQPPAYWYARVREREPDIAEARARMVAFVEHLDAGIGKVLDTLEELGLKENTIVFFSSDNGGLLKVASNNGPYRAGKGHMYDGGLRTAAGLRWPNRIKPGQTTNFVGYTMDVIPTIAELCGISIQHEIEGDSFAELLLTGSQASFDRPIYHTWLQKHKTKEALRWGDWKLVNDPWTPYDDRSGVTYQLYNLKADPLETSDVSREETEKFNEMTSLLNAYINSTRSINWKRPN